MDPGTLLAVVLGGTLLVVAARMCTETPPVQMDVAYVAPLHNSPYPLNTEDSSKDPQDHLGMHHIAARLGTGKHAWTPSVQAWVSSL